MERLRAARREDLGIEEDLRTFLPRHLAESLPWYQAGARVDAAGSLAATLEEVEAEFERPRPDGTLVLRADVHGGLLELGDGILAASLEHVLDPSRAPLRGRHQRAPPAGGAGPDHDPRAGPAAG